MNDKNKKTNSSNKLKPSKEYERTKTPSQSSIKSNNSLIKEVESHYKYV